MSARHILILASRRCYRCGRFCVPADSATPWGIPSDPKMPDPRDWCKRCAKAAERAQVAAGYVLNSHWIKPAWERRAAKRLGYVPAGPKGAAWSQWYRPERVPPDYVVRETP